ALRDERLRVLHPEVHGEVVPSAPVQLAFQGRRLGPGDVEQGEVVPDGRVSGLQLIEVLSGGRPTTPDVRVVALDVPGTGGGPVRHRQDPNPAAHGRPSVWVADP